jgi:hypothetical protein
MQFLIGNPWGWLGLLGLPVVVLLFMLQQKSRPQRTSTLFLLEHLMPESRGGRRLQRLVQSVPLWLMLAAVALLTWLLLDPRKVDQRSRQSVVVVLDSSLSMQAFEARRKGAMQDPLERLAATAGRSHWVLMETDLGKPLLYRGEALSGLWEALEGWKAQMGTHETSDALKAARLLAGADGLVVFVTDSKPEVPEGTGWIAVGERLENVGFAGGVVRRGASSGAGASWEAVLRNYSDRAMKTQWRVEGMEAQARPLELQAGEGVLLKGNFPPGEREVVLALEPDAFGLDDRIPLLVPEEKVLQVSFVRAAGTGPEMSAFMQAMGRFLPGFREAREGTVPDMVVLSGQSRNLSGYGKNAVVFYRGTGGKHSASLPVMETHELTRDLSWNGLLADPLEWAAPLSGDEILLWKDGKPLIVLRTVETAQGPACQLHFLFDFEQSNASRLPACVVLLYRFCELIRAEAVGYSSGNVVFGQVLQIKGMPGKPVETAGRAVAGTHPRAPVHASFFNVSQEGRILFRGASQFSETLEADFRLAETADGTGQLVLKQGRANSEKDAWAPVWILLLGGCLLSAWWWEAPARAKDGDSEKGVGF